VEAKVRLQQLEAFRMVARTLNVTRSAARLHYAQSSVTEQIQTLEVELGVALFERRGRRLRLTTAGERMLAYAEQMLSLADEARGAVVGATPLAGPPTTVTIAAPETLCAERLPPALTWLRERSPEVHVAVRSASRAELQRAVTDRTADVCLGLGAAPRDDDVAVEALAPEPLVLVAAPDHQLAARGHVTTTEIRGAAWLATERGCAYRDAFERGVGSSARDGAHWPVAELSSIRTLLACVAAGQGIALVPEVAAAAELARGTVVRIAWQTPGESMCAVWMAWAPARFNPALASVIATLRETLQRPAGESPITDARPARLTVR
jgi:DNA-binding transcriptional LysR family regulator